MVIKKNPTYFWPPENFGLKGQYNVYKLLFFFWGGGRLTLYIPKEWK